MQQVFIVNPKGGCGKTTLATQLSGYYACQGQSVALVDHDRQRSASDWIKCRPKGTPVIDSFAAYRGEKPVNGYHFIIHDLPAACEIEDLTSYLTDHATLLIPILPSSTDIKAAVRFLIALNSDTYMAEHKIKIGLIANRVRFNTHYIKVLSAFLDAVNLPLITHIRDTQNYIRAISNGISIFDLPPHRVTADVKQWIPLINWIESHSTVQH